MGTMRIADLHSLYECKQTVRNPVVMLSSLSCGVVLSRDLLDNMSSELHLRINLTTCRRVFSLLITTVTNSGEI